MLAGFKDYARFSALVYSPMLVTTACLTPLMAAMFPEVLLGGTPRERFDVGCFLLTIPLLWLSMSIARRQQSVRALFWTIYPFALWFYYYALYLCNAAVAGLSDAHVDPIIRLQQEMQETAFGFVYPFGWPIHLFIVALCWRQAEQLYKHVNTVRHRFEW